MKIFQSRFRARFLKEKGWRRGNLWLLGLSLPVMQLGSTAVRAAVMVESNLVYGTAPDYTGSNVSLLLDAYYPDSTQTNRPVVILTHGGGFAGGDKGYTAAQGNFYPDMATAFASNNFVAFSIDYRLWPGCPGGCPDEIAMAVQDVMTAVGWIQANSAHYGIDATRVLIAGDSAGGGLAVNASYAPTNVSSFFGCISLWGGVPPYGTNINPITDSPITSQTPPTCMIHGTADTVVPYAVSVNLSSNLTAAGVYNELHPLAGYNHYPVMSTNGYDTNLVATIIGYMIPFALRTAANSQSAPVFLGDHLLQAANGQFTFDLTGPTNATVAVEQSSNLTGSWHAIATNQLVTGSSFVTNAILATNEFYRARVISP